MKPGPYPILYQKYIQLTSGILHLVIYAYMDFWPIKIGKCDACDGVKLFFHYVSNGKMLFESFYDSEPQNINYSKL